MRRLLLSILSGLLLSFSWPYVGYYGFIFIAFVPLLILESSISRDSSNRSLKIFGYSFLSFFIFNIITTYWIWHATLIGAFAAFFINAFLMSFTFLLFHRARRYFRGSVLIKYCLFGSLWLCMEYLHLNWEFAWPWLTLGNVFASFPNHVPWYSFTGILGGSLWVLTVNYVVFLSLIRKGVERSVSRKKGVVIYLLFRLKWIFVFILTPYIFTYYITKSSDLMSNDIDGMIEVVIVQPNIDPYQDKFERDAQEQLDDFILLARNNLTSNTQLLVGPETMIQEVMWEGKIEGSTSIRKLQSLQDDFPNLNILVGASTCQFLGNNRGSSSRRIKNTDNWYNMYNSAIFLEKDSTISIYHKRKLVPGVEQIPYSSILSILGDLTVELGGVSGSLASDNTLFSFQMDDSIDITPLICYESVFGEILQASDPHFIIVITNDGWWKNTSGHKQHFAYARLRALEQGKTIIRAANTGVSGYIGRSSKVGKTADWDQEVSIISNIPYYEDKEPTFYNQFGDYIGRISSFLAVLLICYSLVKSKLTKKPPSFEDGF